VQFPIAKIFRIAPAVPTITSACYARTNTEDGVRLEFRVSGFSNTRELRSARITIPGLAATRQGIKLVVPSDFTFERGDTIQVEAGELAAGYFSSAASVPAGGAFTLAIPAIFEGDPAYLAPTAKIQGVQVELTNGVGVSGSRAAALCP
jgi:hypothetical protein